MNPLVPTTLDVLFAMGWIIAVILAVIALLSLAREPIGTDGKIAWSVFIIFVPLAGAVTYFILWQRRRHEEVTVTMTDRERSAI